MRVFITWFSNSFLFLGQCLAGAGGGGFMYVITKNPNAVKEISDKLAELGVSHSIALSKRVPFSYEAWTTVFSP